MLGVGMSRRRFMEFRGEGVGEGDLGKAPGVEVVVEEVGGGVRERDGPALDVEEDLCGFGVDVEAGLEGPGVDVDLDGGRGGSGGEGASLRRRADASVEDEGAGDADAGAGADAGTGARYAG